MKVLNTTPSANSYIIFQNKPIGADTPTQGGETIACENSWPAANNKLTQTLIYEY
jgi:hypothetical protein